LKYKNDNPLHGWGNEKAFVVQNYLPKLNPKLDKLYDIAYSLKFDEAFIYIKQKTAQIEGFNIQNFLLNQDYDFKPFSIESIDKKLIENTKAIEKAVSKFFDSFTKDLNPEQKTILSKNLFQTVNFFIQGNDFKKLVEYISNQSE
jgi:hypothetical protein